MYADKARGNEDMDEGRVHKQLAPEAERLSSMQAHAHKSWDVAHPSQTFVFGAGKVYAIGQRAPGAPWKVLRELPAQRRVETRVGGVKRIRAVRIPVIHESLTM